MSDFKLFNLGLGLLIVLDTINNAKLEATELSYISVLLIPLL